MTLGNPLAALHVLVALGLSGLGCRASTASPDDVARDAASVPAVSAATSAGPPSTATEAVVDTYHGHAITDPYRWLEAGDDPKVQAWSEAQNAWARAWLDARPTRPALTKEVEAILAAPVVGYADLHRAGGKLFASKRQPPKPQPLVVVLDSADDPTTERVLLDPAVLDPDGTTSVDWFRPSPDGKLVAVSLSVGGSESGDVHVFDVATGKRVHEIIERVNGGTAGGDLAWAPDSRSFWYTRYPRAGERAPEDMAFFQQLWFHRLGDPVASDRYEVGQDFPRIAEIQIDVDEASSRVLATVQLGDGGQFMHWLRDPKKGAWTKISAFEDRIVHVAFAPKGKLYAVSRAGAPRGKLLVTSARAPDLAKASVLIPEREETLVTDFWSGGTVVATKSRIYVLYQTGGPSKIVAFDASGKPAAGPEAPPVSAVGQIVATNGDDLLFDVTSYVEPHSWFSWNAKAAATTKLPISSESPADFSDIDVRREMATSKDGTQIPVNILVPEGIDPDGSHPALLTGYGGFGVSLVPYQRATWAVLLDRGFVIAVANLRGGSEYGDEWHEQGRLLKKQNVFDDFAAAAQHLVTRGYTSHERLALEGGSNGGLLMGATLVQHPELARAVVSHVGIYDMLRVELSANGAFNVSEFGTVKDPAQFRALHAYSPYHHVKDGTEYPAVLFMTGANDPRVDPMQSRKMTARLQAAQKSDGRPILLRTSGTTGHGGGTPLQERVAQTVDAYAFLLAELGLE
jgi:prolyl oligopeptidase